MPGETESGFGVATGCRVPARVEDLVQLTGRIARGMA